MSGTLHGKVALVSGAGRGIGRAIALKLASAGARVVVNDLDAEPTHDCIDAIRQAGGHAVPCVGSVSEIGFAERFIETATAHFGGLDIIVNNAGYTWDSVIHKMTDAQWDAIIDCHLTAPFRILRAAQPVIRRLHAEEAAHGQPPVRKVVNISSMAGLFGNVGQSNYASAKAGIVGLTQTLAKEWGRLKVTVNCVAYGLIRTRLTESAAAGTTAMIAGQEIKVGINADLMASLERTIPLGRAGTPADAAGAVYMFCIPEADYISGQTLTCSGGLTGL